MEYQVFSTFHFTHYLKLADVSRLIQTYSKASSLARLVDDKVDKCVFILNVSLCLLIRHAVHLHCTQLDNKSVTKAEIKTDEDCSTDKMVTGVNIHHG